LAKNAISIRLIGFCDKKEREDWGFFKKTNIKLCYEHQKQMDTALFHFKIRHLTPNKTIHLEWNNLMYCVLAEREGFRLTRRNEVSLMATKTLRTNRWI
jgi:hypothetical protein